MNLQDRELELNFREITCKRSVANDAFAAGVQDFDFSVSGKHAFIPSLSYFVIKARLNTYARETPISTTGNLATGIPIPNVIPGKIARIPYVSDQLTLADHFGSTLYNNCFFRAGNSDVSTISQYIPQAAVLKSRLDKSGAWTKYCGRDLMLDDPDFTRRVNKVSLDGTFHEDGLNVGAGNKRICISTTGVVATALSTATWDPATQLITFNGAPLINPLASCISPNDVLYFVSALGPPVEYYKLRVIEVLPDQRVRALPLNFPINTIFTTSEFVQCIAPADPRCGFNDLQVIFQPPLGIFSTVNPISGGDFKITLNPNPNYKVAGVQSNWVLTPGVDYDLVIDNVLFYCCQIRADVSPTGIIPLSLLEMSVLNKSLSGLSPGGSQNIDFTVPPSTLALTVFVQSTKAGNNTQYSPTQFYSASNVLGTTNQSITNTNLVNNIQYIQVTYGSVSKTQTLYSSSYVPLKNDRTTLAGDGINNNIQRWLQSIQYSGKITSEGGTESDPNFLDRGNYWHFDFSRDKNDTSSYVNVQLSFNNSYVPPVGADQSDQLFIVAHYSRQAEIQYENGFITQVISVNR